MDPDNGITIKTLLTDIILFMDRIFRTVDDRLTDNQINFPNRNDEIRSNNGNYNNQNGTWRNNGNFSRSPSGQGRVCSQGNSFCRPQLIQPINSLFRRSDGNPSAKFLFLRTKIFTNEQSNINERGPVHHH